MANKSTPKPAKDAPKKPSPEVKKGQKLCKRSGIQQALPYISVLFGLILGLCFIFVGVAKKEQPALVFTYKFFFGLIGGAAYFLPLVLIFTGVVWCALHLKYAPKDAREGSERLHEFISANRRAVTKTVLCFLELFMLSVILGIFYYTNAGLEYSVAEIWTVSSNVDNFVTGGMFGGAIAYICCLFSDVIMLIVLFILFIFTFMVIIGITPQYIYNKAQYRKELADTVEEYDEEEDERRREMLRAKELEKMKKRRQHQHISEQKKEAKQYARAHKDDDGELQPVAAGSKKNTENASEVKENEAAQPKKAEETEVDILLDGIGIIDDDDDDDDDVIATAAPSESAGIDYGGDSAIDGSPSVDDLLMGIGKAPAPKKAPTDDKIEMSQISEDELNADMQNIMPEKAEEVIQEEIVLPYVFPPIEKLSINKNAIDPNVQAELQENAKTLKDTLKSFNVQIREINYSRGPTVTRYELKPEVGTKVKSIANLVDDIALNLATSGVRIEAPIPNKPAVGIEVPNRHPEIVYLRDLIESSKFTDSKSRVTACLGKDIGGNPICFDIAKMPHLLIAGATGMGKSVCINCIIISLLYKARPEEVKLILIDPKKVEFAMYKDIPHLYAPIVSDPKKAAGALASAVVEMERRFELIENAGVRNIDGYNQSIANDPNQQKLPQIVIVIDELADLMMTAGKDVESCICRLAQKARAAGIHIIIGTQRPSVDVITGLIKANIPSRIACTVASQIDSRTILDMAGAEKLIGRGDMLFSPVGSSKPMRVQGAFVSDAEVEDIVTFVKTHNSAAKYDDSFISTMESSAKNIGAKKGESANEELDEGSSFGGGDTKFEEAVKLAIESGKISTSLLQRRLGVGYGRAAKLIDLMEEKGYVSAANGTKPREVLITMNEFLEMKASGDIDE